jgi:ribosome-associated heat shock protein Hsp15
MKGGKSLQAKKETAPDIGDSGQKAIRIDKWLWHARKIKTRSGASRLVREGKIRVNGAKITKPSGMVKPGDMITAMIGGRLHMLEILALGTRRGPAREAAELYRDHSPPPPRKDEAPRPQPPRRDPGTGRPTKRERRLTDRLRRKSLYGGE